MDLQNTGGLGQRAAKADEKWKEEKGTGRYKKAQANSKSRHLICLSLV